MIGHVCLFSQPYHGRGAVHASLVYSTVQDSGYARRKKQSAYLLLLPCVMVAVAEGRKEAGSQADGRRYDGISRALLTGPREK